MRKLNNFIKRFTPLFIILAYRNVRDTIIYVVFRVRYKRILKRLQHKRPPYNVSFLITTVGGWKYDSLFQLMLKDELFNPMIVICPLVNRGKDFMINTMRECQEYIEQKGYPTYCEFNLTDGTYIGNNEQSPDIVFLTSPYNGQVAPQYNINNLSNALTCYISYGIEINPFRWCYALDTHQRVWRHFLGNKDDFEYINKFCPWATSNRFVSGYPTFETIIRGGSLPTAWKNANPNYKRIIYAPHHTIEGNTGLLHFSTFLMYGEFMLELAQKYKDKIQFVFKPHPLLRVNLENHPDWGKERTDAYYRQWEDGDNTNFVNGEYVDLFNSSDAMIHDCVSFMFEYMCTQKPALFLANAIDMEQYNKLGTALYESHYKAKSQEEIEHFIDSVVLRGEDDMHAQRTSLYQKYILPPNGHSAAENMIYEIKKELKI